MVNKNFQIILTGANGLVGQEVLNFLHTHHPEIKVTALIRSTPPKYLSGVHYVQGDLNHDLPEELFGNGPVILIHLASILKAPHLSDYRKVNVGGTEALLKMGGAQIIKVIYGSSMSVYGQGPFHKVAEETPPHPETDLALSRFEAEEVIRQFCENKKIPFYLLRPRFLFGLRDKETMPSLKKLQAKGLLIGDGSQKYSYILVDDYAEIIAHLALLPDSQSTGVLNISYPDPLSLKEIFSLFDSGKKMRSIPAKFIMVLGKFFPPLKKLRIKMQLIGQDQVLDVTKLLMLVPEVKKFNGKDKLTNIVNAIKEVL
jgi:nucleoside-diphosphate-sugar epimerase